MIHLLFYILCISLFFVTSCQLYSCLSKLLVSVFLFLLVLARVCWPRNRDMPDLAMLHVYYSTVASVCDGQFKKRFMKVVSSSYNHHRHRILRPFNFDSKWVILSFLTAEKCVEILLCHNHTYTADAVD